MGWDLLRFHTIILFTNNTDCILRKVEISLYEKCTNHLTRCPFKILIILIGMVPLVFLSLSALSIQHTSASIQRCKSRNIMEHASIYSWIRWRDSVWSGGNDDNSVSHVGNDDGRGDYDDSDNCGGGNHRGRGGRRQKEEATPQETKGKMLFKF